MATIPFTKKWLDNLELDAKSGERIKATSQSFTGRIKVDSEHVYLTPEEQEKILRELISKIERKVR